MTPFFSIIIPVYNVAPYLRECLDSVLNQTFNDWETICVDDGSTDGSAAILDEYAARDHRFRVIHQANAGVSAARNKALGVAKGVYLGFIDADDCIADWWLGEACLLAKTYATDIIRMGFCQGKKYEKDSSNKVAIFHGENYTYWRWETYLREGWTWRNFIRRQKSCGIVFPVGIKICEDNVFMLRVSGKCDSCCEVDYKGYYYRSRVDSSSRTRHDATQCYHFIVTIVKMWQKSGAEIKDESNYIAIERVLSIEIWRNFLWFLEDGVWGRAHAREQLKKVLAVCVRYGLVPADRQIRKWSLPYYVFKRHKIILLFYVEALLLRIYRMLRYGRI